MNKPHEWVTVVTTHINPDGTWSTTSRTYTLEQYKEMFNGSDDENSVND